MPAVWCATQLRTDLSPLRNVKLQARGRMLRLQDDLVAPGDAAVGAPRSGSVSLRRLLSREA